MPKFHIYITYTDRFTVRAKNKEEARKKIKEAWIQTGLEYEKMRIERAPWDEKEDSLDDMKP